MNQQESIELWRQGKDAWNAWAEEMLREQAGLEKAGAWQADENGEGQNEETRFWIAAASVDFTGLRFITQALADAVMQQAEQQKEELQSLELFVEDEINFAGFIFPRKAQFEGAQFHVEVKFEDAQFHGRADFWDAQFHRGARFSGVQFYWKTMFGRARFQGKAKFEHVRFHGQANFLSAQFYGEAEFWDTQFHDQADFKNAQFGDKQNRQDADFNGIKVERAFDLTGARFSKVPAFNQADFAQAPDLDDVNYPQPPFFRFWIRGWEDEEKTTRRAETLKAGAAKYRHLRRLANLGQDHENEAKAFKGETRAKRGTEHLPWLATFWFGLGYDTLSDFGRSMMRPFYAWLAVTALFAGVYLWNANQSVADWGRGCPSPLGTTRTSKALSLSLSNALPLLASTRGEETKAIYTCLYGDADPKGVFPIPAWSPFLQVLQNLLSAFLIFLFLLGVRNQFRIK